MSYRNFEELKHLSKDEAKRLYKEAYSRFKTTEKKEYFKLHLPIILGQVIGGAFGSYFYNSTHLFIYTGLIGAFIGLFFTRKLIQKQIEPYIQDVVNKSLT